MHRRDISGRRGALAGVLVLAMALLAGAAHAADRRVTSSSAISLSGTVYDSNTESLVTLGGWLHVVTHVTFPNDPIQPISIDAYFNLPAIDVVAENQTYAGLRYLAYGAASTSLQWDQAVPPNPTLLNAFVLTLLTPNPLRQGLPPSPIRLGVEVQWTFDSAGQLDALNSVATVFVQTEGP